MQMIELENLVKSQVQEIVDLISQPNFELLQIKTLEVNNFYFAFSSFVCL
jgi:hypothetical protein